MRAAIKEGELQLMSTKQERHLKPSSSPLPYHGGGQISTTNVWGKLIQAGQRSNIGKTISDSNLTEPNQHSHEKHK